MINRKQMLDTSSNMKHQCIGEFKIDVEMLDDDGEEYTQKVYIPWTTMKDIYAMMLNIKLNEIEADSK